MRVRAVWIPFNCPTILYSQWFSLMSHFFGGFLSVFSTIFREDAISFAYAGKLWLHLLNVSLASHIVNPDSSFFNNLVRSAGSTFRQLPCRQLQG
ncbi:uncharacterized protein FOBCDRAFT_228904 [Fusarium oxysporum Fo47]|uniref:uncharacterized protein n=1 Tax=Fusarium oxysporum Fo47 TaxID=660027 RepID=UPI00286985DC|nr:uncharacterized protein FOBCDRAFT_228904 [Fusarium oxysporum Fo47]WJG35988.1 hypothetical protein FOBCDRAFT_228904 [Fusarium oxysporum Fo47]